MRAGAGLGGWGRSLSIVLSSAECVLMPVLGLGTQGTPDSPMSLSRPQFLYLRSSVLGAGRCCRNQDLEAKKAVSRGLQMGGATVRALAWREGLH